MLFRMGERDKRERIHSEDKWFNLATMHGDKWWERVLLPRQKMAFWQENGKRNLKKQGDEMLSGLPGWSRWVLKTRWKREC